jgi:hypothetical protein
MQDNQEPTVDQTESLPSSVPPVITPPPKGIKGFFSKKSVLGILGIIVLLLSVGAGIALVQIRQRLAQKAAIPNLCGNLDVMLVIDRSSTMNTAESDGRKKLEWAKDAAGAFVKTIADTPKNGSVRIGVSSFGAQGNDGTGILSADRSSTLHSPLTSDYAALQQAISGVNYIHSGTCIECGLRIANTELAAKKLSSPQVVILLSDGMSNHTWNGGTTNAQQAAIDAANAGRSQGVTYYSIGYGKPGDINEGELKSIAGSDSRYQYKPNVDQWTNTFVNLANLLCPVPTATPSATPEITATPTESPTASPTEAATATPTVTPTVTPTPTLETVASPTETPSQLIAQVVSTPTPTPSPTATVVSTATPVPTATAAPQLALASPVPNPTATPAPKLPEAGVSLPTLAAIFFGLSIFLWSSFLAFQHYQD